ncbi:hypothetical protein [Haloterrigena gelatinilytica]|nr:hypothetical protein [Haloterrigena gelatinilytica]
MARYRIDEQDPYIPEGLGWDGRKNNPYHEEETYDCDLLNL